MYRNRNIIFISLSALFWLWACNPTKDKWLNRQYHTLTGHFNIYFNGEQKLLEAIQQLEASHQNNFNKVLDVFPMGGPDAAKAAGNILDEAIKKFSKAVQMHTIGYYTDDSYFAMGQCRFYKQDYFSSIETFQYVLGKYKNGEFTDASTCFIARNYIGLNKLGEAEALMGLLLARKKFRKEDIGLIYATAADINIKQEKYTTAIENLKLALTGKLSKDQKIRYHFILGQLCVLAGKKPEAAYHYNKVVSYVPPYDFAFNANIGLTNIYDLNDPRSVEKVRKNLRKMAADEKNIDYLDQIYFELGKIELARKNYPEAIRSFKKSVATSTKNTAQKGKSYHELAKLFFDQKDYKNSQSYYDSTVMFFDKNSKEYQTISSTKTVLSDLINNLKVFETEDSLQKLSLLSKDELDRRVNGWIAEQKRLEDLAAKEAKKKAKQQASAAQNQSLIPPAGGNQIPGSGDNSWYFYNSTLVNAGAAEFFSNKKWGQRANEDYWRLAAKEKPKQEPANSPGNNNNSDTTSKDKGNGGTVKEVIPEPKTTVSTGNADKDKWIKNIPFTKEQKSRSDARVLEALHNLGVIYYDRLKNPKESVHYLKLMQKRFPASEYEPEAFYYQYKALTDLSLKAEAEDNKTNLISKYPDHYLSLMVQNKTVQTTENSSDKELNAAYEEMFKAYEAGNCATVKQMKSDLDKKYPGNKMKPRIDLMNAICIGKTQTREDYRKALKDISDAYKGTDIAKTADDYLEILDKQDKRAAVVGKDSNNTMESFDIETETPFYYVLAIKNNKLDFDEFVSKYSAFNDAYASEANLRVNAIVSNEGYQLITIREFPNYKAAYEYLKTVRATQMKVKNLNYTEESPEFIISTKNFRTVLKDKKIEKFAEFYTKQEAVLLNQKK